jgi:hypothetical protein
VREPTRNLTLQDIDQLFEDTYESIRAENSGGLDPDALRAAKRQVLLYWEKLGAEVASKVTETEVPLSLMGQKTPKNNIPYSIYGIVDVVKEGEQVTLYDIKSHSTMTQIHDDKEKYSPQLNIYAYVWKKLRNVMVSRTCIIATEPPASLTQIRDLEELVNHPDFLDWDPIVDIEFDETRMVDTIDEFGEVVDDIENRHFEPMSSALIVESGVKNDGQVYCRKCDARFSCDAYKEYAQQKSGVTARSVQFYMDSGMTDEELAQRQDESVL